MAIKKQRTMTLAEKTERYWVMSRTWNDRPNVGDRKVPEYKLTQGGAITACRKILEQTDPSKLLSKSVSNFLSSIIYQDEPANEKSNCGQPR